MPQQQQLHLVARQPGDRSYTTGLIIHPSIGLAASGAGNIGSFTATNAGTSPVTAIITVTPAYTNGGTTCNGTPNIIYDNC